MRTIIELRYNLFAFFACVSSAVADDVSRPLLGVPGKVLVETLFDDPIKSPWRIQNGRWEAKDGVLWGSPVGGENHGAVLRLDTPLKNFIIECEFCFRDARTASLRIARGDKGHLARITVTSRDVSLQKDDNDHDGPDQAVSFGTLPITIKPGTWHRLRLEMAGDHILGQIDEQVLWGSNPVLGEARSSPGITSGGGTLTLRKFVMREATLNPNWSEIKDKLSNRQSPP